MWEAEEQQLLGIRTTQEEDDSLNNFSLTVITTRTIITAGGGRKGLDLLFGLIYKQLSSVVVVIDLKCSAIYSFRCYRFHINCRLELRSTCLYCLTPLLRILLLRLLYFIGAEENVYTELGVSKRYDLCPEFINDLENDNF